jgi:hypothetical protein
MNNVFKALKSLLNQKFLNKSITVDNELLKFYKNLHKLTLSEYKLV